MVEHESKRELIEEFPETLKDLCIEFWCMQEKYEKTLKIGESRWDAFLKDRYPEILQHEQPR